VTEIARERFASRREAAAFVLCNLEAWATGGEVSIAYESEPGGGVCVVVEQLRQVFARAGSRAA
jgi:hypothetical protein